MKPTQAQKIIDRIRDEGELHSWQMTTEMFIQQYNARIYDARKILKCTCKFGKNPFCQAEEHIISDENNHFVYKSDTAVKEEVMGSGYQKWLQTGAKVFNKKVKPAPEYASIKTSELENRKQIAENWLRENNNHEKYREALTRYESICDELSRRNINETLL